MNKPFQFRQHRRRIVNRVVQVNRPIEQSCPIVRAAERKRVQCPIYRIDLWPATICHAKKETHETKVKNQINCNRCSTNFNTIRFSSSDHIHASKHWTLHNSAWCNRHRDHSTTNNRKKKRNNLTHRQVFPNNGNGVGPGTSLYGRTFSTRLFKFTLVSVDASAKFCAWIQVPAVSNCCVDCVVVAIRRTMQFRANRIFLIDFIFDDCNYLFRFFIVS